MAYCAPRGLAHSAFKAWDPLDQAKALAWQGRESEKCSGCGLHPDLTDPERGGHPDAVQLVSVLCHPCEIREARQKDFQQNRLPGEHQVWRATPPAP